KKSFDLADCERLLSRYIKYVDDGHVYISRTVSYRQKQEAHTTAGLNPSFSILSDSTVIIRIPSAELKYRKQIDSLIRSNSPLLTRVPYMIIDVRGNRGGGDAAFSKLKPYLYTHPVIRHLPEFLATPANISMYRQLAENHEVPPDTREFLRGFIRKMEKAPNTFVSMTGKLTDTLKYDSVYTNPRKIGILIDRQCGSATEEFLLFSKQSSKVLIFGKENSSGTLDFSNLRTVELPSGFWTVTVPTSRSSRLPQLPFDKTGISPDVRLPKRDRRALPVVLNYLETADY
ncbi:MAG TPA: S41 family peptidase, partial [Sphingobacteriaceae bacterium]